MDISENIDAFHSFLQTHLNTVKKRDSMTQKTESQGCLILLLFLCGPYVSHSLMNSETLPDGMEELN